MMKYIIYLSSATDLPDDSDLKSILVKSRENNTRDGITGVLLYHEGNFIQVLEGEGEKIHDTYMRILNDKCHKGVHKMIEREAAQRGFPDWSMGFKTISGEQFKAIEGYRDLHQEDVVSDVDSTLGANHPILILLKSFATTSQI
jgi:hypothetical protein